MDQNEDEQRIRRLFDRLRPVDERMTPPFARVLQAPAAQRVAPAGLPLGRLALGAAVVATLAVVSFRLVAHGPTPEARVAAAEAAPFYWQSPTAALLSPPGENPARRTLSGRTPGVEEGSEGR